MKNKTFASLLAFGMLSVALPSISISDGFGVRSIFHINTALAATTATADISGAVYEGDTVASGNPGKADVIIEFYNSGVLMPVDMKTGSDGTFSATGLSGVTSACIAYPNGYQLNSPQDCYFFTPEASGTVTHIDFTIGKVPATALASTTLNITGKILADRGAASIIAAPGLVSVEVRDLSGALIATGYTERSGGYVISVVPAQYNACVIVPGGYGIISGDRCQQVQFPDQSDIVLGDVTLSTLPVMNKNGDGTIAVDYGSSYSDAGATASKDGRDLTDLISVSGLPDTHEHGLYVVTYAVTDPVSGLSATTTRVVQVGLPPRSSSVVGSVARGGSVSVNASASAPTVVAVPLQVIASTSASTTEVVSSSTDTVAEEKQQLKKYLREKAMGSVLGAEAVGTNTPQQNAVVISTTALKERPLPQVIGSYTKALLGLFAFAIAIAGLAWWKHKQQDR